MISKEAIDGKRITSRLDKEDDKDLKRLDSLYLLTIF